MRSLSVFALALLAPLAACGDDSLVGGSPQDGGGGSGQGGAPAGGDAAGGEGGTGGGGVETVYEKTFVGSGNDVQTSFRETKHPDGSRTIHGETLGDLSVYFEGQVALVEAVEDAELDVDGRLVSADLRHRISYNDTMVIERRVVVDGLSGTVVITRPNGELTLTYPTEHPLVPIVFKLSEIIPWSLVSAAECAILQGAERAGTQNLNVDTVYTFDFLSQTAGTGMPAAELLYGDVSCQYDEATGNLVDIDSTTWGFFNTDDGALDLVADAIDVSAASNVITPQVCGEPARVSAFEVGSSSGETLRGQIDFPEGAGPFPVVVFNSGAGGGDREGNYFGAPQWTCLSEALVAAGIAAARYDDPGYGESTGDFYELSFADRDFDAAAVAGAVADHPDVNPAALFLLGHSEGGNHISRAAIATPEVTGLIFVAAVARSDADDPLSQRGVLHGNAGYSQSIVDDFQQSFEDFVTEALTGGLTPAEAAPHTPLYWQQLFLSDGAADAITAARPTLVIHGGGDWQVSPSEADLFEAAFNESGLDFEVHRFPDLGHFQTHNAPGYLGVGEEYGLPVAFDPGVETAIITWVNQHTP